MTLLKFMSENPWLTVFLVLAGIFTLVLIGVQIEKIVEIRLKSKHFIRAIPMESIPGHKRVSRDRDPTSPDLKPVCAPKVTPIRPEPPEDEPA